MEPLGKNLKVSYTCHWPRHLKYILKCLGSLQFAGLDEYNFWKCLLFSSIFSPTLKKNRQIHTGVKKSSWKDHLCVWIYNFLSPQKLCEFQVYICTHLFRFPWHRVRGCLLKVSKSFPNKLNDSRHLFCIKYHIRFQATQNDK